MNAVRKTLRWGVLVLMTLLLVFLQGQMPWEEASALAAPKYTTVKFEAHYEDDMDNLMKTRGTIQARIAHGDQTAAANIYGSNNNTQFSGSVNLVLYDETTGEAYQYTYLDPILPRGYQLRDQKFDYATNTWHYYVQWTGKQDYTATITLQNWDLATPLADITDLNFRLEILSRVSNSGWSLDCGAPDSMTCLGDGVWQATWKDVTIAHPDVDTTKGEWSASDSNTNYRITMDCDQLTPWYGAATVTDGETHYSASTTTTSNEASFSQRYVKELDWYLRISNSVEGSKYVTGPYAEFYDVSPYSIWLVDENGVEVPGTRKAMEHTYINSFGGSAAAQYSWTIPGFDEDGNRNKNDRWKIMTDFSVSNLPPYWRQRKIYYGDTLHISTGRFTISHTSGFLTWDDNANALGLRPESLSYRFRLADGYETRPGSEYIQSAEFAWKKSVTVYGDTSAVYPLYDLEGNELDYIMEADNPSSYYEMELIKERDDRVGAEPMSSTDDYRVKRYSLVMTLPTRKITASVGFENETDEGKNRPSMMVFVIKYADGTEVPFNNPIRTADAGSNWIAEWDVPLYDANGNLAEYKIEPITNPPLHALTKDSPVVTKSTDDETGETTENHAFTYVEQENWNYAIDLIWDKSDPAQWYELYEIVQSNNKARDVKYKLTIRVNAAQYDVGDLEVRLPYHMVGVDNYNNDAYYAPADIGVPKDPLYNASNPFNYYIDDHGTADKGDDEIVFRNWTPITDSINQTIEVKYSVCPSQMRDTTLSVFQATGKGIATYQNAAGEQVEQPAETKVTSPITYGIDNGHSASITIYESSSKILYEGDSFQLGDYRYSITPSQHDEYVYVGYDMLYSVTPNQFLTGTLQLEIPEGAYILEFDRYTNFTKDTSAENTWNHTNIIYPTLNKDNPNTYDSFQVVVAYPRTNPGAEDEEYDLWLKATYNTHTLHEHENDKVEGLDFNDEHVDVEEVHKTWTPKKAAAPSGSIYSASKSGTSMPEYGIEYFNAGTDITTPYFSASTTVNGNLLKKPFQIISADDAMFARMQGPDGTTEWVHLTAEDYFFHKAQVFVSWSRYDEETGSNVYDNVPRGDFILQGQTAYGDQWEEIGRAQLPENVGTSSGMYLSFDEALFEGKRYTGMRVISPEGLTGSVSLRLYVYTTLLADSPLYQSYIADGATKIEFDNYSAHYIYVQDPVTGEYEWFNGYAVPYNITDASINGLNEKDYNRLNSYVMRYHQNLSTGYTSKTSSISKTLLSSTNDNVNSKVDARFSVTVREGHRYANSIPGYFDELAWQEGVFYDLLPPGYTLNEAAGIKVTGGNSSLPCSLVRYETVDNYKNSGRQLVRFYVQYDGEKGTNWSHSSNSYYGPAFTIEYSASISWTEWSYAPSGYNLVAFQEGHGEKGQPIYNALPDDGAYFNKTTFGTDMQEVMSDLNGDGDTTGSNTLCSSLYFSVDVVGAYATGVNKLVKANSGYYRMHDVADLSGDYSYKISFTASEGGTTRDLVLFDILEEAANTGTTNGVANANEIWWEGTLTGVDTGLPIRQGIQPRVFYSTSESLTYGAIDKVLNDDKTPVLNYLADTSVWKEWTGANPPADLSAVTALAFDLTTNTEGEPYVFEGSSATYVEIFMQAPATLPEEVLAYNRPSYFTTFTTGAQHSEGTSTHNINDRVTVELRDLKDFSFIKLGEYEEIDGVKQYEPLSGICFDLYRCTHECDKDCADACIHAHTGKPGSADACWDTNILRTVYSMADGSVNFNKLSSGSYAVVETSTRTGFIALNDMWWIIDVDATAKGGISQPVNGGTAANHVSLSQDASGAYTLKNDRVRKEITVYKYWQNENKDYSYRPEKILIDLYQNGEMYREGIELEVPTNTTSHRFVIENLYTYSFQGKTNTFTVEERPVPGYSCDIQTETNRFNIYNSRLGIMQISKQVVDGDTGKDFTFHITLTQNDAPVTGDFGLLRVDAEGQQTTGTVTATDHGVLTVTARHGETVTVLDLPVGAVYSVEEEAIPGYTPTLTQGAATGTVTSGGIYTLAFTNTYDATGTLELTALKTVNGQAIAPAEAEKFSFTLTGTDGSNQTKQNDADGQVTFDAIRYTLSDAGKSFLYTVKESQEDIAGYTPDDREYTIAVWVSDQGDGTLEVRKAIQTGGQSVTEITFDNAYEASGEWTPTASKTVNGAEPREDQVYEFLLTGEGEELPAENLKGEITFETLRYDLADAGKTYTYTVKEITAPTDQLVPDATEYTVNVSVKNNYDGTLTVEPTIVKAGEATQTIAFDNTLYAPLTISKTVEGCETAETFAITVRLFDANGTELTEAFAFTGDAEGEITSGGFIQLGHGQSVTISGLLPGMTYSVEEESDTAFTTMVNGSEGALAEGTLAEDANEVSFVNTFRTTTFTVTKHWQGGGGGAIELTLYANGEKVAPQPAPTRDGNVYMYTDLPMYGEQGEFLVYSAKEKYVDGFTTIYSNISPFSEETRAIYDGGTIINKAIVEADFSVKKVWSGLAEGETAPEITLVLYRNGVATDEKTPTPDRYGWYKYYDLPGEVDGEPAIYTVKEEVLEGYETSYTLSDGSSADYADNGGTITNAKVPATGDQSHVLLWTALLGVSAALLLVLKRRRA